MAFLYYRQLTVDHTKIGGSVDLTNFTVLVDITNASLKTVGNGGNVQNGSGYDIVFYKDDGTTTLNFELVSYSATTGRIVAWVLIPTLTYSSDFVFRVYYGNTSISTSQENITGTWPTSIYFGVYHLEADAANLPDASNQNAIPRSSSPSIVAGVVANGMDFASNGAYYTGATGTNYPSTTGKKSMSAWVTTPSSLAAIKSVMGWGLKAVNGDTFRMAINGSTNQLFLDANGRFCHCTTPSDDVAHHIALVVPVTSANISDCKIFVDGVSQSITVDTDGAIVPAARGLTIGERVGNIGGGQRWVGQIDEARVLLDAPPDNWWTAEYNNQGSPSTFLSLGSESVVTTPTNMQASITGSGDIPSADLKLTTPMQATVTGSGDIPSANLSTYVGMAAVVDGSGSITSANLTSYVDMEADLDGSGTVSGSATLVIGMEANLHGSGDVEGELSLYRAPVAQEAVDNSEPLRELGRRWTPRGLAR